MLFVLDFDSGQMELDSALTGPGFDPHSPTSVCRLTPPYKQGEVVQQKLGTGIFHLLQVALSVSVKIIYFIMSVIIISLALNLNDQLLGEHQMLNFQEISSPNGS